MLGESSEIAVAVLGEQGACQHVAEQQNNTDDFIGLDAAWDNPLGKIAGVRLQSFKSSGLERFNIVVIDVCLEAVSKPHHASRTGY
jgi:hypothetical protein